MHTKDKSQENFQKLAALFPNAVTETVKDGQIVRAIDKDVLMQEISAEVVEGKDERYQFTWPQKKQAVLLANSPTTKTLRPCKEESVNFDSTKNLYIEGDNLEVLKLLQETYLGKVKMIYIDPPYNTGKDSFVYDDKRTTSAEEYKDMAATDDDGNLVYDFRGNAESNGYFHTDWLNMMYPRLRLARDLLTDDGVIFISIDDNEVSNLKKICDEIFGGNNLLTNFIRKGSGGRQDSKFFAIIHEYVLVYAKNINMFVSGKEIKLNEKYPYIDIEKNKNFKIQLLRKWGENSKRSDRPNLFYSIKAPDKSDIFPMLNDNEEGCWRWGKEKMETALANNDIFFLKKDDSWIPYEKIYEPDEDNQKTKLYTTIIDDVSSATGASLLINLFQDKIFSYPKPTDFIKKIIKLTSFSSGIILDFFSGSATTAHAVMQLNAEDGGKRQFIMVQLPEVTDGKSEAYKAGYKNICEIGKERIRRAGKKILEENKLTEQDLDIGFRVLKLDSTNMKDVYYVPAQYNRSLMQELETNIKEDRSAEDLLFQVLLDLGIELSCTIETTTIQNKTLYNVNTNFLIACFDTDLSEEIITEAAKQKPQYAVFRDSSLSSDTMAVNFEQIFKTYSPETVTKVL